MTHLSIPPFWRLQKQKYALTGAKCTKCSVTYFPQRRVCVKCHSQVFDEIGLSGVGKLVSWTTIRAAPDGFEAPYHVAIVELEEGPTFTSQLIGSPENFKVGSPVKAAFRRLQENGDGLILYGIKFELVEN